MCVSSSISKTWYFNAACQLVYISGQQPCICATHDFFFNLLEVFHIKYEWQLCFSALTVMSWHHELIHQGLQSARLCKSSAGQASTASTINSSNGLNSQCVSAFCHGLFICLAGALQVCHCHLWQYYHYCDQ